VHIGYGSGGEFPFTSHKVVIPHFYVHLLIVVIGDEVDIIPAVRRISFLLFLLFLILNQHQEFCLILPFFTAIFYHHPIKTKKESI